MQTIQSQNLPTFTFNIGKRVQMPSGRGMSLSCLTFLPGNRRLDIVMPSPGSQELRQFYEGELRMALVCRGAAVVLLHRFGNLPWQTAVLDGKTLGSGKLRAFKSLARERREPFQFSIALNDQRTRALLATRHAMLSPLFASMIGKAMRSVEANAKDLQSQIADLDWLTTQYPPDLLSLASIYERAVPVHTGGVKAQVVVPSASR